MTNEEWNELEALVMTFVRDTTKGRKGAGDNAAVVKYCEEGTPGLQGDMEAFKQAVIQLIRSPAHR